MAQPFPPAGDQKQYNERPLKVYGEQYTTPGDLPVHAVINPGSAGMLLFSDGVPRVPLASGWVVVTVTDWVISNRYTGQPIEVVSDEEFSERFGGKGGSTPLPAD